MTSSDDDRPGRRGGRSGSGGGVLYGYELRTIWQTNKYPFIKVVPYYDATYIIYTIVPVISIEIMSS